MWNGNQIESLAGDKIIFSWDWSTAKEVSLSFYPQQICRVVVEEKCFILSSVCPVITLKLKSSNDWSCGGTYFDEPSKKCPTTSQSIPTRILSICSFRSYKTLLYFDSTLIYACTRIRQQHRICLNSSPYGFRESNIVLLFVCQAWVTAHLAPYCNIQCVQCILIARIKDTNSFGFGNDEILFVYSSYNV